MKTIKKALTEKELKRLDCLLKEHEQKLIKGGIVILDTEIV